MVRRLLCIAALFLMAGGVLAADRVALVIGNGAYEGVPALTNPANDATAIADVLDGMGFEVIKGVDLDETGMEQVLRRFVSAMKDARIVLFYYSGHGLQVGGKNYLIPVDASLEDEAALDFETIDADKVFAYMGGNDRIALAFLDACRDNPFARSLARSGGLTRGSVETGLAVPETLGSGLFIGFSTAPNDTAADGEGTNSPFTTAMIRHLPTPGLEINQVLTRVKADVRTATNNRQRPWTNSDLMSDLYLVPEDVAPAVAEVPPVVGPVETVPPVNANAVFEAQSLLLEASDGGSTGAVPFSGTVTWSRSDDEAGMPMLLGEANIPARNLRAQIIIRKNFDASLPASHLMEVTFEHGAAFVGGSIAGFPGVLLKNEELIQGTPLIGASARIVGDSFLFAMSASPADITSNTDLLRSQKWMDLAIIYANGRRAILTLEKDPLSQQMFADVLRAWDAGAGADMVLGKTSERSETDADERIIEVKEPAPLRDVLLKIQVDERTIEKIRTTLRMVINSASLPAGTAVRIRFSRAGPNGRTVQRLSLYFPDTTGELRHATTVALTDNGSFVLGMAPGPLQTEDGLLFGSSERAEQPVDLGGKVDRFSAAVN